MGKENESKTIYDEYSRRLGIDDFTHYNEKCDFHRMLKHGPRGMEMRASVAYATDIYRALCNMRWRRKGFINYFKAIFWKKRNHNNCVYSCTWRYAGGLVAEIRGLGETYLDFYCSGGEGKIAKYIKRNFEREGWVPFSWGDRGDRIVMKVKEFIKKMEMFKRSDK